MLHTSWYLWHCSAYACHCSDWGHDIGFLNGSRAWNFRCLNILSFARKKKKRKEKCSAKVTYVCVHCISNSNFGTLSWPWCWHFFFAWKQFLHIVYFVYFAYSTALLGKDWKGSFGPQKKWLLLLIIQSFVECLISRWALSASQHWPYIYSADPCFWADWLHSSHVMQNGYTSSHVMKKE